jgi:hypothetical protein
MTVWTFLPAIIAVAAISLVGRQVMKRIKEKRLHAQLEKAKKTKWEERTWESKALNMVGKNALPRLVNYYHFQMPGMTKIEIYQRLIADLELNNELLLGQRHHHAKLAEPLGRKSS